jgi:hypothetical protein
MNGTICTTPFSKSFVNRAVYYFGSWREAVFQAGIRKPKPYSWSDLLFYTKKYYDKTGILLNPMDEDDLWDDEEWVPIFSDVDEVWMKRYGGLPRHRSDQYNELRKAVKDRYFRREWTRDEIIDWGVEFYKNNFGRFPREVKDIQVVFTAPHIKGVISYKELIEELHKITFNIELLDIDESDKPESPKKFDDLSLLTDFGDEDGDEIENPLSEDMVNGVQKNLYKSSNGKKVSENPILHQVNQYTIPSLSKPNFEKFAMGTDTFNKPFANYTRKKRWSQDEIDYLLSETIYKMEAEKYTKIAEYLDRTVIAIRKKAYRLGIRKKRYGIGGSKLFYSSDDD